MSTITQDYESGYLDSVYVISHSQKTVKTYRTSLNHLRKFTSDRYETDLSDIIPKIRSEEIDVYDYLQEFIIYLDKLNIKPKGLRGYLKKDIPRNLKGKKLDIPQLRKLGTIINHAELKEVGLA